MADPRSRRAVLSLSASALLSLAGCVGVGSDLEREVPSDLTGVRFERRRENQTPQAVA
jgi:hypothetical protein